MTSLKLKDFSDFLLARQKLRWNPLPKQTPLRISLLGWSQLELFAQVIETVFASNGVAVQMQTAPYNSWESEILQHQSALKTADLCIFFLQPLATLPSAVDLDQEQVRRKNLLEKWSQSSSSQNYLFEDLSVPAWWPQAALSRKMPLTPEVPAGFQILPLQHLANQKGQENFFDSRSWYESKTYFHADALVDIAQEIFLQWKNPLLTKVLAIDLDQTLWGGVLSEDGVSGLKIGGHDPTGEFYNDFQTYLKDLKTQGIVLALVSKNDLVAVQEAFADLDMPLKISDFVSIKASWNQKHLAIYELSQELNISLDQILFIDDDAYEIQEAVHFLPDLQTVHLSSNLTRRIPQVRERIRWDFGNQTQEDLTRTQKYLENQNRDQSLTGFSSFEDFLKDLNIRVSLKHFAEPDLLRIHQLFQKTNQFNQKTQRLNMETLSEILKGNSKIQGFSYQVQDRFGDLGIVGAILVETQGRQLKIHDWVMSCRALNRNVENQVLKSLLEIFPQIQKIELEMIPTEKNLVFKNVIHQLSFVAGPHAHIYFRESLDA